MNKLLIVSATSGNNLVLAEKLNQLCLSIDINTDLVNLEEYNIPLYTPNEQKKSIPLKVDIILNKFISADGFIFCAPEYNGSIPPILTSTFAWLSVINNDWRLVFNGKFALIATHSGGGGNNFIQSIRIQLNHLGTVVLPRVIVVNNKSEFDEDSSKNKIQQLVDLF